MLIKVTDTRLCTCHPDDNPPVPCAQQYALSMCNIPTLPPNSWIDVHNDRSSERGYHPIGWKPLSVLEP